MCLHNLLDNLVLEIEFIRFLPENESTYIFPLKSNFMTFNKESIIHYEVTFHDFLELHW